MLRLRSHVSPMIFLTSAELAEDERMMGDRPLALELCALCASVLDSDLASAESAPPR